MTEEGQFKQRVLGKRLTFLSDHPGVRQAIRERMNADHDPLDIITSLEVNGEYIDLVKTKKRDFIDILERLMPGVGGEEGAGKKYERIAQDDTDQNRKDAWIYWEARLRRPNGDLHEKLTNAINELLDDEMAVSVSGDSDSDQDVVWDDPQHRLIFQVPRAHMEGKLAGPEPE